MNPTSLLGQFYANDPQREAVKEFFVDMLKELAVEKAFAGEDTLGIAEAKQVIDNAFVRLDQTYGKMEKPIISSSR